MHAKIIQSVTFGDFIQKNKHYECEVTLLYESGDDEKNFLSAQTIKDDYFFHLNAEDKSRLQKQLNKESDEANSNTSYFSFLKHLGFSEGRGNLPHEVFFKAIDNK